MQLVNVELAVLMRMREALNELIPPVEIKRVEDLAEGRDAILWNAGRRSVVDDIDRAITVIKQKEPANGRR